MGDTVGTIADSPTDVKMNETDERNNTKGKHQRQLSLIDGAGSEEENGRRRQPKDAIGTTKQFPTEAGANKEADRLRCRPNEKQTKLEPKS
jgi:hypothetical protein